MNSEKTYTSLQKYISIYITKNKNCLSQYTIVNSVTIWKITEIRTNFYIDVKTWLEMAALAIRRVACTTRGSYNL